MQHRSIARVRRLGTVMAASFICWCNVAHAQSEPPIDMPVEGRSRQGAENQLGFQNAPEDGDQIVIGVGGAYMPAYIGAKKYRFQPLPALDIKLGRFFANFQNGIGAHVIDTETLSIGAGITMADNYRGKDAPDGIGKLKMGAGARGFVSVRQFGFEATAGVTKIVAGSTGGMLADFSLSRPIVVSDRLFLMPSVGATWADRKHNNRYFGVNERQSLASGLPEFSVGSGFVNAKAELGLQYRLTDRIGLGVMGGVSTMFGDAKKSPIVEEKTRPYGIGFVSYRF